PAALTRKRRYRQHLDRRDAELPQAAQAGPDGVEGTLVRERADVQLVEHELVERDAPPRRVRPRELAGIDDTRRAANPVRLETRARIRVRLTAVEREQVVVAGRAAEPADVQPRFCAFERVRAGRGMHRERA